MLFFWPSCEATFYFILAGGGGRRDVSLSADGCTNVLQQFTQLFSKSTITINRIII